MNESFFDADGINLNYVELGKGPALLLIPAQLATWESYIPVLEGLGKSFHVFALSIRGHGKSSRTTGEYNFNLIGRDLTLFLERVVKEPAIVSGNSSGGLIALWLAVNKPKLIRGIVIEDAPLFSADWPRIKHEFVYEVLSKTAKYLGASDYFGFFNSIASPRRDGSVASLPKSLSKLLAWLFVNRDKLLGKFLSFFLPERLRRLLKFLPSFDPDFSKAWVDGRIYKGLNHASALGKLKKPALIIHADWYQSSKGLIGAMNDKDAKRARELAPHARYVRLHSAHAVHSSKPKEFIKLVNEFAKSL